MCRKEKKMEKRLSSHFQYFEVVAFGSKAIEEKAQRFQRVVTVTKEDSMSPVLGAGVQLGAAPAQ